MQFSSFQKNLNDWQGALLILGVVEEEIESQLEGIKFIVDPKLLLKKLTTKKFKGEKGKCLNFEFLDQKLDSLIILGLGKSKDLNKGEIKNSLGDLIRKIVDKNEKISILLPWELTNSQLEINHLAESVRLSAYKDNRFNKKKDEKKVLKEIEFLNTNKFENINFEPRVNLTDVIVNHPNDTNDLEVTIAYDIIGQEATPQEITFILQPTRV